MSEVVLLHTVPTLFGTCDPWPTRRPAEHASFRPTGKSSWCLSPGLRHLLTLEPQWSVRTELPVLEGRMGAEPPSPRSPVGAAPPMLQPLVVQTEPPSSRGLVATGTPLFRWCRSRIVFKMSGRVSKCYYFGNGSESDIPQVSKEKSLLYKVKSLCRVCRGEGRYETLAEDVSTSAAGAVTGKASTIDEPALSTASTTCRRDKDGVCSKQPHMVGMRARFRLHWSMKIRPQGIEPFNPLV